MNELKLFENSQIRSVWDEEQEEWFFSIVDIVAALTGSSNPRRYWSDLKRKITEDEGGIELYEKIVQLKMQSSDNKFYRTDASDMSGIFRIIQSIPSPKAEPFKLWLAQVGKERIDEIIDPELTIDRALQTYLQKGYSKEWINQRLQAIQVRKELTDEWQSHGVQHGAEYAILTNEISRAWSGMSTKEYKTFKGLKKENLRDNMTTLELVLNMLSEATTTELTRQTNPQGLDENKAVAKRGGTVAGNARKEIEAQTGKPVISKQKAIDFAKLIEDVTKNK
ncbi:BRO family protein [Actinobacillus genomosp. 2]|uniref:BRO family protein n=1 Tax=Actinobacillus genomosp. 2 TaxID=230709 RepID=UPI0024420A3E|nr:BRO family protein [Actinobacillus genomosp. 2]WGE32760.1 BRO family protein [Actinobacillus genomosp. 2]